MGVGPGARKRTVRYAGGALAVLMLGQCTPDGCTPPPPPATEIELQVLSFNDFHGHLAPPGGTDTTLGAQLDPTATPVGGAEYLSTVLATLRTRAPHSVTVAAGDLIGGTPFLSGLFHDEPAVESLNALGLDVSAVGNHEFDEGVDELLRMQNGGCRADDGCYAPWGGGGYPGADFSWLAANVVDEATGQTVLPGTTVQEVDGVKVGYIGMTLEDTPVLVAQSGIQGIEFRDEVLTANAAARALRRQGVRTIIVLLHEGGFQAGNFNQCNGISGPIVAIASELDPEIDLVVTGHTHFPYVCNIPDPYGDARMVTSASSFGRVVTDTRLFIDKASGQVDRNRTMATNHLVARANSADPVQTEIIARWSAASAPIANEVIGTVSGDITRGLTRGVEGPLANLIADAQLAATAAEEFGGADLALMNPGGVRADLTFAGISGGEQPGEVTYGEAFAVQPFGNTLVVMDLTGEQIQRLLEQQTIVTTAPGVTPVLTRTLIFGVSDGLTFSYDTGGAIGSRIPDDSVLLDGAPLDPTATYQVTTNSFLADGGDAFTVFREGTNRIGGGEDLVAFIAYLGANSPVGPPADRITGI